MDLKDRRMFNVCIAMRRKHGTRYFVGSARSTYFPSARCVARRRIVGIWIQAGAKSILRSSKLNVTIHVADTATHTSRVQVMQVNGGSLRNVPIARRISNVPNTAPRAVRDNRSAKIWNYTETNAQTIRRNPDQRTS